MAHWPWSTQAHSNTRLVSLPSCSSLPKADYGTLGPTDSCPCAAPATVRIQTHKRWILLRSSPCPERHPHRCADLLYYKPPGSSHPPSNPKAGAASLAPPTTAWTFISWPCLPFTSPGQSSTTTHSGLISSHQGHTGPICTCL